MAIDVSLGRWMRVARCGAAGVAVVAALAVAPVARAEEAAEVADNLVRQSNRVIARLVALQGDGELDADSALEVIRSDMSPLLDFQRLAQRAMGKYWRRAEEEERARVVAAFRGLLENTYAKVLRKFSGQKVELVSAKDLAEGKSSVVLKVFDAENSAEIDYVFEESEGGETLISDIKVEGVSLISNYRRQFASIIKKSGVDGLVEKLEQLAAR